MGSITPIPSTPISSKAAAVTPEVAASGDVGSANVHMGTANVDARPASAEVPPGKVSTNTSPSSPRKRDPVFQRRQR